MPLKNGTGPPKGGGGLGGGRGTGGGRMGGGYAAGPGGNCVCPNCGATASHPRGVPCNQMTCPKCGSNMTRSTSS